MGNKIFAPKGTKDIVGQEVLIWRYIEDVIREVCDSLSFHEIRTPSFEHTSVFSRGVGDTTDIVNKEMYGLKHKGKDDFSLKPEGTSSVIRAYIEHSLGANTPVSKLFYITSCFRCENPQKGRLRQFHQFGVEAIGSKDASIDGQVIFLADLFFKKLGVKNLTLKINSVGCPECRSVYYEKLRDFLKKDEENLCYDCKNRLEKNPMRVLDCKVDTCKEIIKGAPLMIDHLCEECETHFEEVKKYLNTGKVAYEVDPKIVRGLDYYTQTAFEFVSKELGSQGTVCGGGRYNGLVKMLGGSDTPGIGFGLGIERLVMIMKEQGLVKDTSSSVTLYIAPLLEEGRYLAFEMLTSLIKEGIKVEMDNMNKSLKAQMKYANKINAKYTAIIGEDEVAKGEVLLRNMETKEQENIKIEDIGKYIV